MADWLQLNHHNINTDKIILLPAKLIGESTRVALPEFILFKEQLKTALYRQKVITRLFGGRVTDTELDKILFYDQASMRLAFQTQNIRDGTIPNVADSSLDMWLVRIENRIDSLGEGDVIKEQYKETIRNIFNNYYSISGYTYQNPLYHPAKLLTVRIGEILLEVVPQITKNKNYQIERLIPGPYLISNFYTNLKSHPNQVTDYPTINAFQELILDTFGSYLSPSQNDKIKALIKDYRAQVELINKGRALLEANPSKRYQRIPDSLRKTLIQNIIDSSPTLQSIIDRPILYSLLFGVRDHTFLTSEMIKSRPWLSTLLAMKYRVAFLTKPDFDSEGLTITSSQLTSLKQSIEKIVNDFILSNQYKSPYINNKLQRNTRALRSLTTMTESIWLAFTVHKSKSDITFNKISKMVKSISLASNLRDGSVTGLDALRKYIVKIDEFIRTTTNPASLLIYNEAKNSILEFMKANGLSLISFLPKRHFYNREFWFEEETRGFHITHLLERNLSFDILTFKTLDDKIFKFGSGTYARHHFRNDPNRRSSIFTKDLVLTDKATHPLYDAFYSEADIEVILQGFNVMKSSDGSGPNGEWTESDIKTLFSSNQWVYQNWLSDSNFKDNLVEFNIRKNLYTSQGLEEFINQKYSTVSNRFFNLYGPGIYSTVMRTSGSLEIMLRQLISLRP